MSDAPLAAADPQPSARVQRAATSRRALVAAVFLLLAVAFPFAATALDHDFYIGFATRVLIYVIAVTSLNLLVGYGGLVSFGHAAYFGFGAYSIAMLSMWSASSGAPWLTVAWFAWPFAMAASAALALVIGALALRTRQVYFIMTTLAFGQMVYYFFIGMKAFGSDNGMSLPGRSRIGFGIDLQNDTSFYFTVLALTVSTLLLASALVRSRFGVVVRGIAENESRMSAIGIPVYRYKLACFVIAGALAGLAGALLANQNSYVSPRLLDWTQSGSLLVMLILGGVGYRCGGIYGTVLLLVLEEVLSGYTSYWQLWVGLGVIAVVLLGNNGIASLFDRALTVMKPRK